MARIQLSAAAHQLRDSLFALTALTAPPTTFAFPALTSNPFGFAVQGVQLNADYLSPGDKLWAIFRKLSPVAPPP